MGYEVSGTVNYGMEITELVANGGVDIDDSNLRAFNVVIREEFCVKSDDYKYFLICDDWSLEAWFKVTIGQESSFIKHPSEEELANMQSNIANAISFIAREYNIEAPEITFGLCLFISYA